MSGFLLDTNILSELRKQSRCDAGVRNWVESTTADELFVSVLVLGEIRQGVERIRFSQTAALRRDFGCTGLIGSWIGCQRPIPGTVGSLLGKKKQRDESRSFLDLPRLLAALRLREHQSGVRLALETAQSRLPPTISSKSQPFSACYILTESRNPDNPQRSRRIGCLPGKNEAAWLITTPVVTFRSTLAVDISVPAWLRWQY